MVRDLFQGLCVLAVWAAQVTIRAQSVSLTAVLK